VVSARTRGRGRRCRDHAPRDRLREQPERGGTATLEHARDFARVRSRTIGRWPVFYGYQSMLGHLLTDPSDDLVQHCPLWIAVYGGSVARGPCSRRRTALRARRGRCGSTPTACTPRAGCQAAPRASCGWTAARTRHRRRARRRVALARASVRGAPARRGVARVSPAPSPQLVQREHPPAAHNSRPLASDTSRMDDDDTPLPLSPLLALHVTRCAVTGALLAWLVCRDGAGPWWRVAVGRC
jgi:hypothetical protein